MKVHCKMIEYLYLPKQLIRERHCQLRIVTSPLIKMSIDRWVVSTCKDCRTRWITHRQLRVIISTLSFFTHLKQHILKFLSQVSITWEHSKFHQCHHKAQSLTSGIQATFEAELIKNQTGKRMMEHNKISSSYDWFKFPMVKNHGGNKKCKF